MTNVRIKAVDVYHAKKQVDNDVYLEHFKKQGKDITNFLNIMGRKKRYIIDNLKENTITMAIEATNQVLKKAGLKGKDIDMIVFSTQVPEVTVPTNAMFIHNAIQAKKGTVIFDMNANCAGMTIAVEQASRYMKSNPHVNTALVVGSDYLSLVADPTDAMTYANFGDASSAIILEKTESDIGFVDAMFEVDSSNRNNILYPQKGLSQTIKAGESAESMLWLPFDGTMSLPYTYEMFEFILKRNQLKIDDVDVFCLSQFAKVNMDEIQKHFDIPEEKVIYVGDKYGYTGTSSPFIALHEGIESGKIKRGDLILFWTIGGGHEFITMLFKY
ncbi:3-oxoacyl-ACP synthase III family protein [Psychrobacillus psychrodurans]|jgi:3-oxoacyl-[acyl-carrier-protein] synthase-3|uniref:ketoacyl-ACP synthase III n=1 Tax=Psychrobacillus psychrodurans TaxID=126157 RepID=UPI0008E6ED97|nr:3-oxoacyl-ACP synthase III family protein [Psychrobacillus psychrodurans]MCK1997624.1 3-oxoacyl-ACP synthase III family protein [Psychrobacillus psychrodurans]MCZ8540589.1 3-oxoacyl-ACP synthase III family protein [Psychrobacillus psychrodurans]SFM66875.1 3-oxoacyl-[acyl-carrier-protein] synthase-3 [Psychrobacillus psychrodurans]